MNTVSLEELNRSASPSAASKRQGSVRQPTRHPTDKMVGVQHGGFLGLLIIGVLVYLGIELNPFLVAGIEGLSAYVGGYMTKERKT